MFLVLKKSKTRDGDSAYFSTYGAAGPLAIPRLLERIGAEDVYMALAEYEAPSEQVSQLLDDSGFVKLHKYKRRDYVQHSHLFYLDIDIREDQPGKWSTAKEASDAIKRAIDAGLPQPSYAVATGGGIHLYWQVDEPVDDPITYKRVAGLLRDANKRLRLRADASPGAAITGIARMPGSINSKNGRRCRVISRKGPVYRFDDLVDQLAEVVGFESTEEAPQSHAFFDAATDLPDYLGGGANTPVAGHEVITEAYDPAPYRQVIRNCGVMQLFKTHPEQCRYPTWFGMMTIAARTTNPCRMAHYLSAFSKNEYDPEAVNDKLKEGKSTDAPMSCSTFAIEHPEVCGQCPHWDGENVRMNPLFVTDPEKSDGLIVVSDIEMPISPDTSGWPATMYGVKFGTTDTDKRYVGTVEGITLPRGYYWDNEQRALTIKQTIEKEDGTKSVAYATLAKHAPIPVAYPTEVSANPFDNTRTDKVLALVVNPDEHRPQSFYNGSFSSKAVLNVSTVANELAENNAYLVSKEHVGLTVHFYRRMLALRGSVEQVQTLGLQRDGSYATLNGRFMPDGTIYQPAMSPGLSRAAAQLMRRQGTFEGWRKAITQWLEHPATTPNHKAVLLASFASAVYSAASDFLDMPAALINAVGPTGRGKSQSLVFAHSVWGKPVAGSYTGADTPAYVMNSLTHLSGVFTSIDEISLFDKKALAELPYQVSLGRARRRLAQNASSGEWTDTSQGSQVWTGTVVTTSNVSIAELLLGSNDQDRAAPLLARVIELDFSQTKPMSSERATELDDITTEIRRHHGHAGDRLAQVLAMMSRDAMERMIREASALARTAVGSDGDSRFARTFAAVGYAVIHLLEAHGILPNAQQLLGPALNMTIAGHKQQRVSVEETFSTRHAMLSFLEEHAERIYLDVSGSLSDTTRDLAVVHTKKDTCVFIVNGPLRRFVKQRTGKALVGPEKIAKFVAAAGLTVVEERQLKKVTVGGRRVVYRATAVTKESFDRLLGDIDAAAPSTTATVIPLRPEDAGDTSAAERDSSDSGPAP